jgi:RND superfamily putative drug exporter
MGVGLATAVFIDATIVRVIMVPATMELIGDGNWWMPRWLDRVVPKLHVEYRPGDTPPEVSEPAAWSSPSEIELDDDGVRL